MIDTDPTEWPVKPSRRHASHVEIYTTSRHVEIEPPDYVSFPQVRENDAGFTVRYTTTGGKSKTIKEWRWRLVAGNGRIRGASSQGFTERRKLVGNLEANMNMIMLDQDQQLAGPSWYLYGVQPEYGVKLPQAGQVLNLPVRTLVIAIHTPDRNWASRLNRNQP